MEAIDIKKLLKHLDFTLFLKEIAKNSITFLGKVVPDIAKNFQDIDFLLSIQTVGVLIELLLEIEDDYGIVVVGELLEAVGLSLDFNWGAWLFLFV